MANIRFVKPKNDNRIRNFPRVQFPEEVIHITTPSPRDVIHITTPHKEDVIHITTPKRKNSHVPPWDLFITCKSDTNSSPKSQTLPPATTPSTNNNNNNYNNKNSSPRKNEEITRKDQGSQKKGSKSSFHKRSSGSPSENNELTTKKSRDVNQSRLLVSDSGENTKAPYKNAKNYSDQKSSVDIDHESKANGAFDKVLDISTINGEEKKSDRRIFSREQSDMSDEPGQVSEAWSSETSSDKADSKCPIMTFYNKFGGDSDDNLSDVLDEEINDLPDVCQPTGVLNGSPGRRHTQQPLQHDTHEHEQKHYHEQEPEQQKFHAPQPVQPMYAPNVKYLDCGSLIRRSVSEVALLDSTNSGSFFSSINESKYYGLDNPALYDSNDAIRDTDKTNNVSDHNRFNKLNHRAKNAWDSAIRNGEYICGSETALDLGYRKNTSGVKTPVHRLPRSVSRDSVISMGERMKMRRFALADPEKMIMSQEVREKIEKDVEKRKSSMVRKVSQFLNIQLGLNKEEDLI